MRKATMTCVMMLAFLSTAAMSGQGGCTPTIVIDNNGNNGGQNNGGTTGPQVGINQPEAGNNTGPAFPNLLSPCPSGNTPDCKLAWQFYLENRLLLVESADANGQRFREYIFLCMSHDYTYVLTHVDGVSPPAQSILGAFVTQQGERQLLLTVNLERQQWELEYLPNGDMAVVFPVGLVEPATPENGALIDQKAYFIMNVDNQGNLHLNGTPAGIYLTGDACF